MAPHMRRHYCLYDLITIFIVTLAFLFFVIDNFNLTYVINIHF